MVSGYLKRLWARARTGWSESSETQKDFLRLAAGFVLILVFAGAVWLAGRPAWRHWRHARALAQAVVFERGHDNRNALLAMRSALALAPGDRATREAAADLLSRIGSPEAVDVREQIMRMAPADPAVRLALVREALRFGETLLAETTLRGVAPEDRGPAYHRLAAMLASALGQTAEAKAQLAAVITADPADEGAKLDFAGLLARSPEAGEVAAGVGGLEALVGVPSTCVRAAVELLKAAARSHDAAVLENRVRWLRGQLAGVPAAAAGGNAQDAWVSLLELLKTKAKTPGDAAMLARWIGRLGQRREMVVWIESLPEELRDAEEVRAVAAELCAEMHDLPRLRELLEAGAWGDIPPGALDLVLAGGEGEVAAGDWAAAAMACGDSVEGLRVLTRLALVWHDDEGAEQVLAKSLERSSRDRWACEQLRALYAREKNTDGLIRLYRRWARFAPDDAGVGASWVTLSAVLDTGDARAAARAAELYAAGPLVPASAVAQAAIWWREGKYGTALEALQALPAEEVGKPAVAFWLGLVEAELGRTESARAALGRVDRQAILPEEAALLEAALAKLNA